MNTSTNPILIYVIASVPVLWRIFQIKNKNNNDFKESLKFQILLLLIPIIGILMHINGITDLRSHVLMIGIVGLILFSVSKLSS